MITLQFLEPGPYIAGLTTSAVKRKLQAALELLPVDALLLGWEVPQEIEEICLEVTDRVGTKLYRWHPLLTGDGTIYPKEEWRAQNLNGQPLLGFGGLSEFTFLCPNNLAARQAVLTHLAELSCSGRYKGIFLDRMRFPSPAANPVNLLTCFCEHCCQAAAKDGLDLAEVRQTLTDTGPIDLLGFLFCKIKSEAESLAVFLKFRQKTITQFIQEVVSIIRTANLEIGLDCFSPSLTCMVGQDLSSLAPLADWTKIMVYGHAFGPATLPFEFIGLANWLKQQEGFNEAEPLAKLAQLTGFKLPALPFTLRGSGFPSESLAAEITRGRQMGSNNRILAGIELVEIPSISELEPAQIKADLQAIKAAGADGLSLSWDLWHIPLDRLELVRSVWFS